MRLEVRELSFTYEKRRVLDRVSLSVDEGEVVGILGPNGSGKTTLIKCINHILVPEGRVTFGEREVSAMSPMERARLMAYVPQALSIGMAMTVFESVLMGRRPHVSWGIGEGDIARVTAVLEDLGLSQLAFRNATQISGGERQKVMIARALVQEPLLLLLDEPTSALDLRHQLEVMEIVRAHAAKKKTGVIMAIHDLNLASRFCDRVLVLSGGRVRGEGRPADVLTEDLVRDVYGVKVRVDRADGFSHIIAIEPAREGP
ncbi:MAG TPA: ABC transporter ATP-binding protein [Methanolinea sp.]|nr:ABC transporter ATP-binding protein [Methanolinea sp.]HRS93323.1 ABC transporter ATP-binding protein [Methanolinea sp.]HRU79202.1 ABC transporter ATP-binding protein [Methanolinea sp.]